MRLEYRYYGKNCTCLLTDDELNGCRGTSFGSQKACQNLLDKYPIGTKYKIFVRKWGDNPKGSGKIANNCYTVGSARTLSYVGIVFLSLSALMLCGMVGACVYTCIEENKKNRLYEKTPSVGKIEAEMEYYPA